MPTFSYIAVDGSGQQINGQVDAKDQAAAAAQVKQLGYFPTRISQGAGGGGAAAPEKAKKVKKKTGGKIKSKVLTVFTRQLATLISAGLPLLRALKTLGKQERNPVLKSTIEALAESVEAGGTFSEALTLHPNIFTKLYVNMVKAGEMGGVLDVVLARLAEFQEKSERIKGKITSAMAYPIVVLFIAFGILIFLMAFIVPKFQAIFKDMLNGAALPWLTQMVIDASDMLVHNFIIIFGALAAVVIGINVFIHTAFGSRLMDQMKLKLPLLGDLITKTAISRFTRTLGTLVSSGVSILAALNITKETSGNQIVSEAIGKVHDSVKEGDTVVGPLEASGIFPPIVVSMVQVGEEVGRLPEMLVRVADVYDEEVDTAVGGLTSLLEPLMIVGLAFVVGTIVIALFLPLISIIQNLGNQSG